MREELVDPIRRLVRQRVPVPFLPELESVQHFQLKQSSCQFIH